jgi:uncharacterized protein
MMSKLYSLPQYQRPVLGILAERIAEPRRFIQVLAGPRQAGKTTMVSQLLAELAFLTLYASADEPSLRSGVWLHEQWDAIRIALRDEPSQSALLVIDEVQKIPDWSETVKRLWDEDTAAGRNVKVVILGSAPLLVQKGLTESLAGRFEIIPVTHWSYPEMNAAFGWNLETYIAYGGYPGAAPLIHDHDRWVRYILDSLVETSISRDVLLLTRVDKPALLRRLFELACNYSGQILSYTKMLGQLTDAGNTTTLAHYLELLSGAGMVLGLPKYSGSIVRRRASSPKLQVMNTALMTAISGIDAADSQADSTYWGRLVESSIGAHLVNAQSRGECRVFYWREGDREVDFVIELGKRNVIAIEVKSGAAPTRHKGMEAFNERYRPNRMLMIGEGGIPVEDFLVSPVSSWET